MRKRYPLAWLAPGQDFPPVQDAWPTASDAPGLLAAGGELSVDSLVRAYSNGIFPWFGKEDPILWWSTDPRMVLELSQFRLHRSLRKTLLRFRADPECEVRVDFAFAQVIAACATAPRKGHPGTWIVPDMVAAYTQLHEAGYAHSVETWIHGKLVGGLYCVSIGRAVFGESMFALQADASKVSLAALVALCRRQGVTLIDCQQNTAHLASLGAREMPRSEFIQMTRSALPRTPLEWTFTPLYWREILGT